MVRDDLVANHLAAILGDEDVVLETDAAKIAPRFDGVVVDELRELLLRAPKVDEVGNEVHARLVGHDEALLQATAATQMVQSELSGRLHLVIVAQIVLAIM